MTLRTTSPHSFSVPKGKTYEKTSVIQTRPEQFDVLTSGRPSRGLVLQVLDREEVCYLWSLLLY